MDGLENEGVISIPEVLKIWTELDGRIRKKVLEQGKRVPMSGIIRMFEEVLDDEGLLKEWKAMRDRVVPYSLFFTLLGEVNDTYVQN